MIYKLGAQEDTWGYLSLVDGQIAYHGDEQHLRLVVDLIRNNGEDDAALMARLPQVLDSPYAWAVPVTEVGA